MPLVFVCRFRRQTHVTPKSYLSFLDGYKTIYAERSGHFFDLAQRMNTGLEKLIEATVSVDALSKELVVKEKELEVANKKADQVTHLVDSWDKLRSS
jgi:dynein heavy chain